ncbi:hypothetical protein CLAFUW4_09205 [Fulvia fulva]|nr:hypothetical protein CLAFUR4_09211 [Fulvia fulva]KAK4614482.1 hypothetical protein CLAFUR0_09203 [Fulvia fulva]WPV20667.1 hypothetical protein CLAFUW4_09205 [Fulvia fulva]WPV35266.1 hypothetical protein CLAFUW7_09206 [Fulvia fulva]
MFTLPLKKPVRPYFILLYNPRVSDQPNIMAALRPPLIISERPTNTEAERIEFYKRCKRDELEEFVKARSKNTTLPVKLKNADSQKQLLQLDRQASFPFLKLPKDIRLLVYEELLEHRPGKRLHSQILSTCKMVQDEAQGFLDKSVARGSFHLMRIHSSQIRCTGGAPRQGAVQAPMPNMNNPPNIQSIIAPQQYYGPPGGKTTSTCSRHDCKCRTDRPSTTVRYGLASASILGPAQNIARELAAFPEIPANASTMHVEIVIEDRCGIIAAPMSDDTHGMWTPSPYINRRLYLLATIVQASNVDTLSVRISVPGHAESFSFFRMLWPLSRLGPHITVTLSGLPQDYIQYLEDEQLDSSYAFTALSRCLPLKARIGELQALIKKSGLTGTGIQFLPTLVKNASNQTDQHVEVHDGGEDGVSSEKCILGNVRAAADIVAEEKWTTLAHRAEGNVRSMEAEEV